MGYILEHPKIAKIPSVPQTIYALGESSVLDKQQLAIVGPRRMSQYAMKVLKTLLGVLGEHKNICIISGGADGVDSLAHTLALEYGIPTIVVLGGGIEASLQTTKRGLLEKVVQSGGLLLSEYEDMFPGMKYTFPQRNRIIAGLADVVFVPEAGEKSGALITVGYAKKAGVPIVAPMQDIFNVYSLGTNKLIESGECIPICDLQSFVSTFFPSLES